MEIEENIAKNAALRENVFMMFVCIELRIPLFLIGKPGSSKSLAKTIIESSMKGRNSKKKIMKQFKQVCIYFLFLFILINDNILGSSTFTSM